MEAAHFMEIMTAGIVACCHDSVIITNYIGFRLLMAPAFLLCCYAIIIQPLD